MFDELPPSTEELMNWTWDDLVPYYNQLISTPLTQQNLVKWLCSWSKVSRCNDELYNRLYVATTVNTADEEAQRRLSTYIDTTYTRALDAEQALKDKLLQSGLQPEGLEVPLQNMRADAEIFCKENLPLLAQEELLNTEYDRIIGAQTVAWQGEELTLSQLIPIYQSADRAEREHAWRLGMSRRIEDREALVDLWGRMLSLRKQIAANAGMQDYREYTWKKLHRFAYTPEDCKKFHDAIEEVVVPAASRICRRRQERLGLDVLRPWDLDVDPIGRAPLRPFSATEELVNGISRIFHRVDPELGGYFDIMAAEGLLDLDNRKNKAPGGYCTEFATVQRPFIFANAVSVHDDVQTMLHEGGHAFHVFESAGLPYFHQQVVPMEFAEVASMGMELLSAGYLARDEGGFYSPEDAARARIEHLESAIRFWPYMAVVDAFQHWVYENPEDAMSGANCDNCWSGLWNRFMPDVDWSGLEDQVATGWLRKEHIFVVPFYYIEYGLAQLGAVQVWENSIHDQAKALQAYRHSLRVGGTHSLPELFSLAGGKLSFGTDAFKKAVALMERTIEELEES